MSRAAPHRGGAAGRFRGSVRGRWACAADGDAPAPAEARPGHPLGPDAGADAARARQGSGRRARAETGARRQSRARRRAAAKLASAAPAPAPQAPAEPEPPDTPSAVEPPVAAAGSRARPGARPARRPPPPDVRRLRGMRAVARARTLGPRRARGRGRLRRSSTSSPAPAADERPCTPFAGPTGDRATLIAARRPFADGARPGRGFTCSRRVAPRSIIRARSACARSPTIMAPARSSRTNIRSGTFADLLDGGSALA